MTASNLGKAVLVIFIMILTLVMIMYVGFGYIIDPAIYYGDEVSKELKNTDYPEKLEIIIYVWFRFLSDPEIYLGFELFNELKNIFNFRNTQDDIDTSEKADPINDKDFRNKNDNEISNEQYVESMASEIPLANVKTDNVKSVIDGDSIELKEVQVQLSLVRTPGNNEQRSAEAAAFVRKICPGGTQVVYDLDSGQKSNAKIKKVNLWCYGYPPDPPSTSLNGLLIQHGFAEIIKSECRTSEFRNEPWAKGC